MKILFIGDIFGSSGRKILETNLASIKNKHAIDLVIANVENSAHGKGLTPKIYAQILSYGVDFMTMGNHTWAKKEILPLLTTKENMVRPLNISETFPFFEYGEGSREFIFKNLRIRVTNIIGSSVNFKGMQTNAFVAMQNLINSVQKPDIHIVDLHAETTSEKYGFLWAFNGQVDAILGTHTHVPTNDSCITEEHTAFICDVGMTGPSTGIIGGFRTPIIKRFFDPTQRFALEVQPGPAQLCSVILEYDEQVKRMVSINPLIIREGFSYTGKPL